MKLKLYISREKATGCKQARTGPVLSAEPAQFWHITTCLQSWQDPRRTDKPARMTSTKAQKTTTRQGATFVGQEPRGPGSVTRPRGSELCQNLHDVLISPVNMPELSRFWADAASIGPEPAQFWHITAWLHSRGFITEESYQYLEVKTLAKFQQMTWASWSTAHSLTKARDTSCLTLK